MQNRKKHLPALIVQVTCYSDLGRVSGSRSGELPSDAASNPPEQLSLCHLLQFIDHVLRLWKGLGFCMLLQFYLQGFTSLCQASILWS